MFLPEVLLQPRWSPGARVMLTNGLQGFVCTARRDQGQGVAKDGGGSARGDCSADSLVPGWIGLDWIGLLSSSAL